MTSEILNFFNNQPIQINLMNFVFSLLTVSILSFFIQIFYIRYSSTLSNRYGFSKTFIVLGVTTCIVIMVVKNSLALSLGLVGALSIVRFRAAIKEPEELVYLFLIIAAGLGCGAGQLKITIIGIIFSLIIIYLYSLISKKDKIDYLDVINLALIINENINDKEINIIVNDIKKISDEVKFVSMSRTISDTNINLDIKVKDFQKLVDLTNLIKKNHKNSKVIVARNNELSL
ncbi:MAG: hypothetical protein CBC25_00655 [Pelagibacteraceae bacterium TMED65]|nr:MAG: hypothetical protein CBC25_00655 [Pelagibacteraceae bacterium TMED65]